MSKFTTLSGALLERDTERSAIDATLDRLADGARGGVLVLHGTAGIGKTTLLQHAITAAADADVTTLTARGTVLDQASPYGTLRQLLQPLARTARAGEAPFDGPAEHLYELITDTASSRDHTDDASLAHALAWLLATLTDTAPVLLSVDDLQWADSGSQRVLALLATQLDTLPVLLAATIRACEQGADTPPIRQIITAPTARTLELAPLSLDAVTTLVGSLYDEQRPGLAAALHETTNGIPFLVHAQLQSVHAHADETDEQLALRVQRDAALGIRLSLQDRLERLGTEAALVLQVVTVLGDHATRELVAEVAELTIGEVQSAVDRLSSAALLDAGGEPLRPHHPLITQSAQSMLDDTQRGQLHRRAFVALRERELPSSMLATHALNMPAAGDAVVAGVLVDAARTALEHGAADLAETLAERAISEHVDAETTIDLLVLAAQSHMKTGSLDRGVARYEQAIERIEGDLNARIRLIVEMAEGLVFAGNITTGLSHFGRARGLVEQDGLGIDDSLFRYVLAHAAITGAMLDSELQDAVLASAQAVVLDDPATDTHADRLLLASLSLGATLAGTDHESTRALALRAFDGIRLVREETADSNVLYGATGALAWCDAYDQEFVVLDAAIEDAKRRNSVMGFATASYCRGAALWRRGHLSDAVMHLTAALEAGGATWRLYRGAAEGACLSALAEAGRVDEARALRDSIDLDQWQGTVMVPFIKVGMAALLEQEGRIDEAIDAYIESTNLRMAWSPNPAVEDGWCRASELLARTDRTEKARAQLDAQREAVERWGAPRTVALLRRGDALLASTPDTATALLQEAITLLRSFRAGHELARTLLWLGAHLRRLGDRSAARTHLHEAIDVARRFGSEAIATEASQELALTGQRVTPRGHTGVTSLTPAELRVAQLAASGMTNRQIAQELFVTVKAIEWHLSHVYPKLGIRGRRELPDTLGSHL